ncbi:pyrroline-5-carboxylate reductase [Aggregatibacter actinomycetemcomitans serotype e str. SCC393]|nr:pyrroline-5-carboxylate reductase [Aggregatibacter actinomycetemcomitans serotype e str. A160]KOE68819.1 pyrroline-5-carboxylate reductase [Aggregatibacter actinomycetemcomitans serotype e str. SCC393]KYK78017.1 pyrroline-5-carboxylate reductase [Aggregatibacter actinomycetemcomitans serotype e str. SA2876]
MQHKLVTFIGGGNMAQAIVFSLLKRGYPADKIIVCDPNEKKRALFAPKGVRTATDNVTAAMQADVVLLAVKPQMLAAVCVPLRAVDFQAKLVISIAAGISLARLTALSGVIYPHSASMAFILMALVAAVAFVVIPRKVGAFLVKQG